MVFTNERGDPIQQHPFAALWGTARMKAELPAWATPHDPAALLRQRLDPLRGVGEVIQDRLHDSSAKTTLDVYGHVFADEEDRIRAAIDAELGSIKCSRCAPSGHPSGV